MDEGRILDKLDAIEEQGRSMLVGLTQLQEQIKTVPRLEDRVAALERWRWAAMGALTASAASLLAQMGEALKVVT